MSDLDQNEILNAIKKGFSDLSDNIAKKDDKKSEPAKTDDTKNLIDEIKSDLKKVKELLTEKPTEPAKPAEHTEPTEPTKTDVKIPAIPEPDPKPEPDPAKPAESNITKFLKRVLIG
jgi:hypothetical protein